MIIRKFSRFKENKIKIHLRNAQLQHSFWMDDFLNTRLEHCQCKCGLCHWASPVVLRCIYWKCVWDVYTQVCGCVHLFTYMGIRGGHEVFSPSRSVFLSWDRISQWTGNLSFSARLTGRKLPRSAASIFLPYHHVWPASVSYPWRLLPSPNMYLYLASSCFFLSMTPNYMFINTSGQNRNVLSMKASILDLALSFFNGVPSVGTGHWARR